MQFSADDTHASQPPQGTDGTTPPQPEDDFYEFPASFAQQRMWFLNELEPDSAFYNIPAAVRLQGRLDIPALEQALREIIRRHETLRTTFTARDGQPYQLIAPGAPAASAAFDLQVTNLCGVPATQREAETLRLAEEEARKPFNLARGPLMRARLLLLDEADQVILISMHHIISDGWSMGVLIREIAVLYAAFSHGQPNPLEELPIQYADYTLWQRDRIQDDGLAKQLDYWKSQLGDDVPVLNLPTDRSRPAVQTFRGDTCAITLPEPLAQALRGLSRAEGGTLFMTLLAAYQTLLYRYSGQQDFAIGSPIANRNQAEVEGLIGLFVNTIVFRAQLEGAGTFRQLLKRVVSKSFEAFANQDLPFDALVEALNPNRDMSYNPIFQVMFILQNAPTSVYEMPGLKIQMLDVGTGASTFDMTLSMAEQADGIIAEIEYNTDLFDRATIQRMLGHFHNLLESIAANPDTPLERLALLSPAERERIIHDWNKPGGAPASGPLPDPRYAWTLPHLLDHAALRFPDLPALFWQAPDGPAPTTLTYAQLHTRANQLAHLLLEQGAARNQPVALLFERSPEMIVALLAVIKTGAPYLPLDPLAPPDRLAFLLEDAKAGILLTQPHLLPSLAQPPARAITLSADFAELAGRPELPPAAGPNSPDDLAYMIYTSGSTGKPKGVRVRQRNLVNQYIAWESAYELDPGLVHLQMASLAFDVFSADFVRALASGGCMVLCPRDFLLDPPRLHRLMLERSIHVAEFVPAVLRELLGYLQQTGQSLPASLRRLVCGSDVWYMGEFRQLLSLCAPPTHLINSFGLTEATIDTCYFDMPDLDLPDDAVVPIGIPFANNTMYVLDRFLQPVPPLVSGELYVGGAAVAEGYHNRPELTGERFVPDPFSADHSARLYKTGDLARYRPLPDGSAVVEFLGRLDFQVKIRGFRVETGEIEAALRAHPAVSQAVVVAREAPAANGARKDLLLVAYVVADPPDLPVEELRAFLSGRLPDYMVPSIFILLEAMPLSVAGKIDRKALPAPDWSREEFGQPYVAPRTPTEQALAELWAQVLQVEQVGAEDNFFHLGGHSLLATQLISRIRAAFGVELPLRQVFELTTVAAQAAAIDAAAQASAAAELEHIPPARHTPGPDGALHAPLSFAQQRLWFLDQLEPGSPFYNIPDAVQLNGQIDLPILERALNEVVRRHAVLRTSFAEIGDEPAQVIHPALALTIPVTDLSSLAPAEREAEVQRLAMEEARRPFRLDTPPLLRARLLRLADEQQIILLTVHHIIGDDWSTNVLIDEISTLYAAYAAGLPSPLPELPIQYADFAAWQRGWLQGEVEGRQVSYWKKQLANLPPLLELPLDHPRPAVQSYRGAYQSFRLSPEATAKLHELANQEGASLFMVLLAAFQALLARYSGMEDICVGTPIAGRNRADIENLIGFFVNTLALRTDLSGDELTFRQLLARTKETCLGAFAHQDLPFERLVEIVRPERNLSHNPLFQVMFVLQNAPRRGKEMPGMAVQPIEAHSGTAKFDLTLFMLEEDERLGGAMEYCTDLFEAETVTRMLEHFANLVEGILAGPDRPVARLSLLSEAERRRLIDQWNQTEYPIPTGKLVHELFAEQAARTPTATAVVYQGESLTYAELDERANRLAHYLQARGAQPDQVIGVCMERSLELMVALLGVLKAGAAYLPLDPTYPADRLAFMVEDSRVPVLLTQERLAGSALMTQIPTGACEILCLDRDWAAVAAQPAAAPACAATPDHLAYIIYTSGSTGKPKGAMIRHLGLTNYLSWCLKAYPLDRGIGTPVHSSISFDLTVTSLYPALLSGKTVFMLPDQQGVEALGNFLAGHEDLSLIKITPAHLKLLGEQVTPERAARLTHAFIIGGENLLVDHIDFWQTHAPATALVNEYGPTETVVGCCVYTAPPGKHQTGVIPIGKPIINTRHYVLDRFLQPVPTGVRGELYIGGLGVGRGYHNRPELTAERFIPDPYDPTPASRMYKSGDLVRWLPDGELECLGRIDFQVKIRGFRVELGEVESVIGQHPAVKEVVVWVREDALSGAAGAKAAEGASAVRRLVAYLVPQDPQSPPKTAELRAYLKERLPDYMVPSYFITLEALPLTANGKLDRKALPEPEAQPELLSGYRAPHNPAEQALVEIWQSVLGLSQVGTADNFFELGGDSILSLQIVTRARQRGLALSPRMLFEYPTIAELAAQAGEGALAQAEQGPLTGPAPLTPVQQWFVDQRLPNPHHWNQSVMLELPRPIDPARLEAAAHALVAHHDALSAHFVTGPGEGWQTVYAPLPEDAHLVDWQDLSAAAEAEREQALAAAQASLNLAHGPLFRIAALWTGDATRLLLAAHHLVVDAVSWRIILEDLVSAYQQIEAGQPVSLPEKTHSFKWWAERLVQDAQAPAVLEGLPFWLEQVEAPAAELPQDDPGAPNREADAESIPVGLSAEDTRLLLQETAQTFRCDVPTAILSALLLALRDWSGAEQWRIELESHGRDTLDGTGDLSRTVGWFTALYPVRFDVSGLETPGAVLNRVKDQLAAVPEPKQSYGMLWANHPDAEIRRRLAPATPAQISLNYFGRVDGLGSAEAETGESAPAFTISTRPRGAERSPEGARSNLWEITGGISAGQLQLEWTFSRAMFRRDTLAQVAEAFTAHLQSFIHGSAGAAQPALNLADFTDFGWDQSDLDAILNAVQPQEDDEAGDEL